MTKLFSSPTRDTFQANMQRESLDGETDPDKIEAALAMIKMYEDFAIDRRSQEQEEAWKLNNLEYDLRSSEYIKQKCATDYYAQNLYAALCNNEFIKNEPWPILKGESWGCSWRYAGGIIADILEEGDYIDWYCSGIRGGWTDEDFNNATKEDQEKYLYMKTKYVSESTVTEEVRADLFSLGWIVKEQTDE